MAGSPLGMLLRHLTGAAEAAAFSAIVSASTAALIEGGLHAMSTVKMKALFVALLISILTLGGAGLLAHHILGVKIPEEPPQAGGERAAAPPPENKAKPAVDRFGDPLPQRAIARLGTVRFRMGGLACACAWSPDGKTLAAGGAGFSSYPIRLFDAVSGKPIRQLRGGPPHSITSLAYSPDGRTLACGGQGWIALWDAATGKLLRQFSCNSGQLTSVTSVWSLAFIPDGKGLISAGEDKRVRLWDPTTGKEIRQFTGHEKDVASLAGQRSRPYTRC